MQQQTKWLVAIGAVATTALAVSLWCLFHEPEPTQPSTDNESSPEPESPEADTPESSPSPSTKPDAFPLKLGSSGHRVERLQVWLLRNFGGKTSKYGLFDLHTQQRVRKAFGTDQVDLATYQKFKMDLPVHQQ